MRSALPTAAATLVAAAVLLSGCGADEPQGTASGGVLAPNGLGGLTAEQILTRTHRAAAKADSVTVAGSFSGPDGTRNYRFRLTREGLDGYVTTPRFGSVDVVAADGQVFLRAGSELYGELLDEPLSRTAAGKWLRISPQAARSSGLLRWTDKRSYLDALLEPQLTSRLKTVGPEASDAGDVIGLAEPDTGTLWVSLTGKPYPVRVDPADDTAGPVLLEDWDGGAAVAAPDPRDTVVMKNTNAAG